MEIFDYIFYRIANFFRKRKGSVVRSWQTTASLLVSILCFCWIASIGISIMTFATFDKNFVVVPLIILTLIIFLAFERRGSRKGYFAKLKKKYSILTTSQRLRMNGFSLLFIAMSLVVLYLAIQFYTVI